MQPDLSGSHYYYHFIMYFGFIFFIIQGLVWIFRKKGVIEKKPTSESDNLEINLIRDDKYYEKGKALRKMYLWGFLLSKTSMRAKSPYIYALLHSIHKLDIADIGVLYLIDSVSSLISGPFLGISADKFGRKKMAILYPFLSIVCILVRIYGTLPMVFCGQILTGLAGGILATCYESWLNFEITKLYGDNKAYIDFFRKDIFSTILFYDSGLSLVVTIISAIIYVCILKIIYI